MSTTNATDPPFTNLARQANKLMEQMMQQQKGFFSFCPGETWTPNVNLYETDGAYLVCVDLAGVDKEKIDLQLADNQLTLRGHRAVPTHDSLEPAPAATEHAAKKPRVHLMEIDHGAFSRQVELPEDALRERITASYVNGMLWIEIPKS